MSPLDSKEIKPVNSKGNQLWIFIGRIDAEAEAPILWPPDAKSWHIAKDPDAGKNWKQKEKRAAEDEVITDKYDPIVIYFIVLGSNLYTVFVFPV